MVAKYFLITARPNIPPAIEFTKMQLRNTGIDKYVDIEKLYLLYNRWVKSKHSSLF